MRRIGMAEAALRTALAAALAAGLAATTAGAQVSLDDVDQGAASEPVTDDSEPVPDGADDLDPVDAADADASPPSPGDEDDERASWERRASDARASVEKARARVKAAVEAYQEMRARNYPRGDAKDAIVQELDASKKALADAERRLERLGISAREADVPPAWIEQD